MGKRPGDLARGPAHRRSDGCRVHQIHRWPRRGEGTQPFFIYWGISLPHYPLQASAKWRDHYPHLPSPRSMYAASVSMLHELIGNVMARVKELGLAEETIFIFQSDHGHSTEERNFWGGGMPGPYRARRNSACSKADSACRRSSVGRVICPPCGARAIRHRLRLAADAGRARRRPAAPRRIDGRSMLPILQSPTRRRSTRSFTGSSATSGRAGRAIGS